MKDSYRVKEGAHWKAAPAGSGERMVCLREGDVVELTEAEADSMRRYLELLPRTSGSAPAAAKKLKAPESPEKQPPPASDPPLIESILSGSWQSAKAAVADLNDPEVVEAVFAAESESGKPRQSVLDACQARIAELLG